MLNIKRLLLISTIFFIFCSMHMVAQKVNQVNAKGERIGKWKKTYDNDKIRYEGQFKDGKEVGTFKFYDILSSSQPTMTKRFSTTSDSSFVKFYTLDGKMKTKGAMIGKNREGKWTYLFTNGKLFSEENYAKGKLNGVLKNYYRNGKVTEETNYKNGLKDGASKKYTDAGILIEHENYTEGKLNGSAKYFDLKGQLKEEGSYNKGKREGKWNFYMDGELIDISKRKKTGLYNKE